MIGYFKKRLKQVIDIRVKSIKENQHRLQQTHFNYAQLSQLFQEDTFIPFSAWAISPSTILHVLNDISINKRKAVIEFGAGASTFYIAKLIKTLQLPIVFYSVEADENWANELNRQLDLMKLSAFVNVIHCPQTKVPSSISYKEQQTWYDTDVLMEVLKEIPEFDLVLVDGPVGASTPFARYSAIPFLKDKISTNFSVFLDDVNRPREAEIVNEWQKILDCKFTRKERYVTFTNAKSFDVTPFQLG